MQTVHTHCASVHQAAKLVAALLRVARVTASLAESNGSLQSGLWLTSPAGWLPRTAISSGTLRSVIEYGLGLHIDSLQIYRRQWLLISQHHSAVSVPLSIKVLITAHKPPTDAISILFSALTYTQNVCNVRSIRIRQQSIQICNSLMTQNCKAWRHKLQRTPASSP